MKFLEIYWCKIYCWLIWHIVVKFLEDEGICAQGLGIDGAPVTLGCLNRVGARLKQLNTFLVQVHCVAHKFALCLSITTKTVNPVSNYKDSIMAVYNNFSHSAVRYNKLKWNKP